MKTGISVRDAMTTKPITATPEESLQEISKRMLKEGVGSIIIQDKGNLVGIISEKDIVERVVAKGLIPKDIKAKDVMTKTLVTVPPNIDIYDALLVMNNEEIRKLPVVDGKRLLGFITVKDIVKIEPAMFEIFSRRLEILKEEKRKPVKITHGRCENCGSEGPLYKVKKRWLCESCKS